MTAKDIQEALAKPFDEEDLEWRCGATNSEKTSCLALVYVTNRAIMNRLDEVVGCENWQATFRRHGDRGVVCNLSIRVDGEWISKEDGADDTDIESIKGGISDAMKRAAVQWGIGRYLYNAVPSWEPAKQVGKSTILTNRPKLKLKDTTEPISTLEDAFKALQAAPLNGLKAAYMAIPSVLRNDQEVVALKDELKGKLTN